MASIAETSQSPEPRRPIPKWPIIIAVGILGIAVASTYINQPAAHHEIYESVAEVVTLEPLEGVQPFATPGIQVPEGFSPPPDITHQEALIPPADPPTFSDQGVEIHQEEMIIFTSQNSWLNPDNAPPFQPEPPSFGYLQSETGGAIEPIPNDSSNLDNNPLSSQWRDMTQELATPIHFLPEHMTAGYFHDIDALNSTDTSDPVARAAAQHIYFNSMADLIYQAQQEVGKDTQEMEMIKEQIGRNDDLILLLDLLWQLSQQGDVVSITVDTQEYHRFIEDFQDLDFSSYHDDPNTFNDNWQKFKAKWSDWLEPWYTSQLNQPTLAVV